MARMMLAEKLTSRGRELKAMEASYVLKRVTRVAGPSVSIPNAMQSLALEMVANQ